MSLLDRFRQPEYIGENRCVPCTSVNIAIAAGGSILATKTISRRLGGIAFGTSLGVIYLRGYLVPGTPTLTKRYFPERILRWFDKDEMVLETDETVKIDPEQVLLSTSVVKPCRDGTDLCLTSSFKEQWRKRIHTIRTGEPAEDCLESALNATSEKNHITINQQGDGFVAYSNNTVIGQWGSRSAVIADVAAAIELSERIPGWEDLTSTEIARVLMSLRIFLQVCPSCDGSVQVDQEIVESCCRSYDVIASTCQDCGDRLFEMEWKRETNIGKKERKTDQPAQPSG